MYLCISLRPLCFWLCKHAALSPVLLPESEPTWQCWDQQWTSDVADNRWDTAPPSNHWAGLPLAQRPQHPHWLLAQGLPVSISLAWSLWCSLAGSLCWPPVAALLKLADTPPGESGLLHCPGVKKKKTHGYHGWMWKVVSNKYLCTFQWKYLRS